MRPPSPLRAWPQSPLPQGQQRVLRDEAIHFLQDAYFAYRAEVHRCALQEVDGLIAQDALLPLRQGVRETWRKVMFE